uniref:Uncharacterized protein n=1 Tax=Anopheles arabiensis TaxID=7173 RepID=A0A182IHF0_ANOAR
MWLVVGLRSGAAIVPSRNDADCCPFCCNGFSLESTCNFCNCCSRSHFAVSIATLAAERSETFLSEAAKLFRCLSCCNSNAAALHLRLASAMIFSFSAISTLTCKACSLSRRSNAERIDVVVDGARFEDPALLAPDRWARDVAGLPSKFTPVSPSRCVASNSCVESKSHLCAGRNSRCRVERNSRRWLGLHVTAPSPIGSALACSADLAFRQGLQAHSLSWMLHDTFAQLKWDHFSHDPHCTISSSPFSPSHARQSFLLSSADISLRVLVERFRVKKIANLNFIANF